MGNPHGDFAIGDYGANTSIALIFALLITLVNWTVICPLVFATALNSLIVALCFTPASSRIS